LKECADPERARRFGSEFAALSPEYFETMSVEQAKILVALFSGSKVLSEMLLSHPELVDALQFSHLQNPRRKEGLQRDVAAFLKPGLQAMDYAGVLRQLRQLKQREMLRIAAQTWLDWEECRKSPKKFRTWRMSASRRSTRLRCVS
jgi:glutamine synthetase adenylyltransferase